MKKQIRFSLFLFLAVLLFKPCSASTPEDFNTALDTLINDFSSVTSWVNNQITRSTAFSAGNMINRPANVKSFPGFELGIQAGASIAWEPTQLQDIQTYAIASDFLNLPGLVFTPIANIYGKVGVFNLAGLGGIDVGAGIGQYSTTLYNDLYGEFTQWHLEGRLQLLPDELTMPLAVSINLGVGKNKGILTVKRSYTEEIASIQYNGNTYYQTLNTTVFMSSDWDVTAFSLKLIASKNLIFITPYAGIGIQTATGDVYTRVGAYGTLKLDPGIPSAIEENPFDIKGPFSHNTPSTFAYRFLGGVQLNLAPMVGLNFSGEMGQNVYSFSAGLVVSVL